jgi:hypothetical protein
MLRSNEGEDINNRRVLFVINGTELCTLRLFCPSNQSSGKPLFCVSLIAVSNSQMHLLLNR